MEEEPANWEEFEKIRAQQDEERVRALEEEEEIRYWEEFDKIRAQQDEERVRALEVERAKIRSVSKTLIYWDIQNMHLPEEYDLKSFSLNISMAMDRVNYKGHISIVAFGDVSKIPSNIQQQLHHAEIEIKDVPGDHWWLNDEFKDEIEKNSQNANSLLITDDDDYDHTSHLVYEMIHPVYSILLGVTKRPANTAFFSMAKHIWLWPELIRGGSPLSSDCVSNWLKLAIEEWHATFPYSDELSSEQDVDCSLSLEMCPEIRAMEEEEEIRYWEEFDKIRAQQDEERVRALEVERAKIRSVSKTLVYWDIQNMHLPEEYDLKLFSLNISMAMDRVNYKGHISIVAFGDVSKTPSNIQQQLHHAEIEIKDVPGDHWWLNDEFKDQIEKNSQNANSLLITDDDDYDHTSHLVYEMIHPVYSILLGVTKRPANTAFFSMAKHIWLWPELIRGGSPLSSDCVSNWLKLAIEEWHATFPDSDELSSEQDVDCSLSLEMCPEIRAMEEEEDEVSSKGRI